MSFGSRGTASSSCGSAACAAAALVLLAASAVGAQAPQPGTGAQADPAPWNVPARSASRPNPLPKSAAVIRQGESLYRRDCELCHGARGAGDGQMAPTLPTKAANIGGRKVQSQSDGALYWKILEGRGVMPTTQVTLTDNERWAIVHFLRTLGRRR